MSQCVTVGCACYFYMKEGWVMETLHLLSSFEQGNNQESIFVAKD
jgi:hypothetical protein